MDFVQKEAKANPEVAEIYNQLETLYKKKLWDAMAQQILECTRHPFFQKPGVLLNMYEQFVKRFEKRINQIRFVQFGVAVAKTNPDAEAGLAFLATIQQVVADDKQASLLALLEQIRGRITLGKLDECKIQVEEAKTQLDGYAGGIMDSLIYSSFHQTAAEYHKAKNNAQEFFNNALLYLTYTPLTEIPALQQVSLASDVGLAALVGRDTYNFGELLQHPIVKVLVGTPHEWIGNMLEAFNHGDIRRFRTIAAESKVPVLAENEQFLNEKIRIMAFMEMVFKRDSKDRKITFSEVATACEVKVNEVELLLMKAFSIKVVKGIIDEVDQTVRVKWVQPRVLDNKQITYVSDALRTWSTKVNTTAQFVEQNAPEILSA